MNVAATIPTSILGRTESIRRVTCSFVSKCSWSVPMHTYTKLYLTFDLIHIVMTAGQRPTIQSNNVYVYPYMHVHVRTCTVHACSLCNIDLYALSRFPSMNLVHCNLHNIQYTHTYMYMYTCIYNIQEMYVHVYIRRKQIPLAS